MAIRAICKLGDPVLRHISEVVHSNEFKTPELVNLLTDLRDTLHEFQRIHGTGRGIAAPQIGVNKRVICIDCKDFSYELINPRFLFKSEEMFTVWDSCFSYWGVEFEVSRHRKVSIEYYTRSGERKELTAVGALAELLQHEIEHLDGAVAIDLLIPPGRVVACRSK